MAPRARSDVRDRMISSALDHLKQRGIQATSLSTIIAAAQAPRGSIYHHLPGGKQEAILAALELHVTRTLTLVEALPVTSPRDLAEALIARKRHRLEADHCSSGSALTAVSMTAENDAQREACGQAYRTIADALARRLEAAGVEPDRSDETAAALMAMLNGATAMALATGDLAMFDAATAHADSLVR